MPSAITSSQDLGDYISALKYGQCTIKGYEIDSAASFSFSGSQTISTTGSSTPALSLTGAPVNTATKSLLRLGNAIASGDTTASGGTYIGGNAPSSGAGSVADWINLQANGTAKFKVDKNGNLTAGTYNKVTVTAPATASTLTIADGKTLTASNSLTLAGTDSTVMTFPASSATVAGLAIAQSFTDTQTFNKTTGTSLAVTGTGNGAVSLGRTAVTQLTNINTGVTTNTASGVITTVTATTAAATTEAGFIVTCGASSTTSAVLLTITAYSGTFSTNGLPLVYATTVGNGSFVIRIANAHGTNALNGTLAIAYAVV